MIITSYLFPNGVFAMDRLKAVLAALGGEKDKLVIDLSCRRRGATWYVAMNKWQILTDFEVNQGERTRIRSWVGKGLTNGVENISLLQQHCSEFLIHAADNEGLQQGIDEELVSKLAEWCAIPVTYAGGGRDLNDLERVMKLSKGKVDLTIGSALDIFGGSTAKFDDCIAWNKRHMYNESS